MCNFGWAHRRALRVAAGLLEWCTVIMMLVNVLGVCLGRWTDLYRTPMAAGPLTLRLHAWWPHVVDACARL